MRSMLLVSIFAALSAVPAAAQSFGAAAGVGDDEVLFGQAETDRETGAVFVYRRSGDGWSQVARLAAEDGVIGDRFGAFIAIAGNRMIVGAPNADAGMGAVYVFERGEDETWRQTAKLIAPERAAHDQFGVELGFDGELALASKADGESSTGAVYAFRRQADGSWEPAGMFPAPEGVGNDEGWGRTLAVLDDGSAVIAAAGADSGRGGIWIFPAGSGSAWGAPVRLSGTELEGRFGAGATVAGE
ncbi:MAG TPA: hypothetical protein VFH69_08880, partial [Gemmatimonadota bacterium]|nr:hypothetical protein [Gemmatimonadota bacterium]